jgi:hypothetical protein
MQGFILNSNRVKDEDLVVSILTNKKLKTLYRFYGARHANINIGYKIDFEALHSAKSSIPMLREVLPLSQKWMFESNRFFTWQQFIKLLFRHLKDVVEIDPFYFYLLEEATLKMQKQNPKRVIIESYLELLDHEGRLHNDFNCFICNEEINTNLTLARSFLPSHKKCVFGKEFSKDKIIVLFDTKSTINFDDEDIEVLYRILLEGL